MPILGNNRNTPLISFKSNSSLNLWNIYISVCNFYRRACTSLKQNFPRLQQLKFVYPVQTRLPFKSTRYNSFSGWIFLKGTAETTVAPVRCSLQTCQVRGSIAEKGSNFQDENWVAAGRRWFAGSFPGKCRRNLRGFEMNRRTKIFGKRFVAQWIKVKGNGSRIEPCFVSTVTVGRSEPRAYPEMNIRIAMPRSNPDRRLKKKSTFALSFPFPSKYS